MLLRCIGKSRIQSQYWRSGRYSFLILSRDILSKIRRVGKIIASSAGGKRERQVYNDWKNHRDRKAHNNDQVSWSWKNSGGTYREESNHRSWSIEDNWNREASVHRKICRSIKINSGLACYWEGSSGVHHKINLSQVSALLEHEYMMI